MKRYLLNITKVAILKIIALVFLKQLCLKLLTAIKSRQSAKKLIFPIFWSLNWVWMQIIWLRLKLLVWKIILRILNVVIFNLSIIKNCFNLLGCLKIYFQSFEKTQIYQNLQQKNWPNSVRCSQFGPLHIDIISGIGTVVHSKELLKQINI